MAHIHTITNAVTSIEITDPQNPGFHWHLVGEERTSSDPFGEGHRHQWRGIRTSEPIAVIEPDE